MFEKLYFALLNKIFFDERLGLLLFDQPLESPQFVIFVTLSVNYYLRQPCQFTNTGCDLSSVMTLLSISVLSVVTGLKPHPVRDRKSGTILNLVFVTLLGQKSDLDQLMKPCPVPISGYYSPF